MSEDIRMWTCFVLFVSIFIVLPVFYFWEIYPCTAFSQPPKLITKFTLFQGCIAQTEEAKIWVPLENIKVIN